MTAIPFVKPSDTFPGCHVCSLGTCTHHYCGLDLLMRPKLIVREHLALRHPSILSALDETVEKMNVEKTDVEQTL